MLLSISMGVTCQVMKAQLTPGPPSPKQTSLSEWKPQNRTMNKLLLLTNLVLYDSLTFKLGYQLVQDASCLTLCKQNLVVSK